MSTKASKIVLIVGGPGAGKTTTARLVAERFDRSMHHEADNIREALVNGFAVPAMPYSAGNLEQFALGRRASTYIAQLYCDAGYTVVVDDTYACHATDGYANLLADPRTVPILMLPTASAMCERMSARGGSFDAVLIGLVRDHHDALMTEFDLAQWNVVDNSSLLVEQTVEQVMRLLNA